VSSPGVCATASLSVEELDAQATDALRSVHVDFRRGDDDAARLFVSGDA
jgi:hypothetical protein